MVQDFMQPRMTQRKRYALVGTGSRAGMYIQAILKRHAPVAQLVALCDSNAIRMKHYATQATYEVPCYYHQDFKQMLLETNPDVVIVCTPDATHHDYIIAAMQHGCDVITEKPMTTTDTACRAILQTIQDTKRTLRVTFNYRYSPRNSKVKEVLQEGRIGEVTQVHFEWLLDTLHGADYFRRWHRDKATSGGLIVHKATHHFDLVNWWLDATPELVFALGGLRFYGRHNAAERGLESKFERSRQDPNSSQDPFALSLEQDPTLKALYLDAEKEDGYFRDKNVFAENITIEDTMSVLVRYDTGALLSYALNAYSPWEGYRVAFTGTKGRLELTVTERPYVLHENGSLLDPSYNIREIIPPKLTLQQQWQRAADVPIEEAHGDHGGGDEKLLEDLFEGANHDPLGRAASHLDGAKSILIGVAANRTFETGQPVKVNDLVNLKEWTKREPTLSV
jgi:predicted dehydrogenase